MEQPPGTSDGLQPQELSSACSLPSVFNLTRNSEECLLKANSIEALHVVQPPSWYVSSGTSNGMVLPVDDSNPPPQPIDQIQPDNAFSNTTVTLSYVSKSHVFTTHNSLSEHSPFYGVPLSKTFSLHPAAYDGGQLVTDTGGAPLCVEMDQHCLQQVSVPVGLAACANSFEFVTPAQVVENVAGLCYLQQAHEISGIQDVESLALETLKSLQQSNPNECKIPLSLEQMQNGGVTGLWDTGAFDGSFPAGHIANSEDQQRNGNPEVLFLISRSEEPVLVQNNQAPASLAVSLNQDFISTLEDSVSPPVASLDEVKDVFILPQTVSEEVNSFIETNNTRQDETGQGESDPTKSVEETDLSSVTDVAIGFDTSISNQLTGNTVDTCKPEQTEQSSNLSGVEEERAAKHTLTNRTLHVSGGLFAKKETIVRKKLPPRTRRGKRLEAIVQNICPIRYKSNHVSSTKKSQCANAQADESADLGSEQDMSFDNSSQDVREEACAEEAVTKPNEKPAELQEKEEETGVTDLNSSESKLSTSCSASVLKHSPDHTSPETLHKPIKYGKKSKKRHKVSNKSRVKVRNQTALPTQQLCAKSPSKRQTLVMSSKGSPRAKKVHAPKRKRKKHKHGQNLIFSPQEPEIKLKYTNYKDDRREKRDETFSPFVRVELKMYPSCTVVNYPEESERLNRGKQQVPSKFSSGAVPATPCLQYGRVSMEAVQRGALVCCLCGGSANAMDLGDLHGPYYPEGFRPVSKTATNSQELREEDSSDTDSSHVANGNTHAALSPPSWTHRKNHRKVREAAALGTYQGWSSEGDLSCSLAPKRSRMDTVTDWYSPPIVPLEASEYWLHEDCGIWSAGVFLVRGKLYGLEKAVKMAKETICSSCQKTGATLGCFFKGCPNKYHYKCAMQSGCVLNEENFSMKCKKHKNKSIKGVSNNEQNSR
ncbi:transcription factor 20 [Colossoma macropomum]|uniref:transcription factor 20 n=1 Tax=Colossoma macropomum TaxID=42526 RepID=UPI001863B5F9|nr:transcription factor 20 [Colossoma macropomum]